MEKVLIKDEKYYIGYDEVTLEMDHYGILFFKPINNNPDFIAIVNKSNMAVVNIIYDSLIV